MSTDEVDLGPSCLPEDTVNWLLVALRDFKAEYPPAAGAWFTLK